MMTELHGTVASRISCSGEARGEPNRPKRNRSRFLAMLGVVCALTLATTAQAASITNNASITNLVFELKQASVDVEKARKALADASAKVVAADKEFAAAEEKEKAAKKKAAVEAKDKLLTAQDNHEKARSILARTERDYWETLAQVGIDARLKKAELKRASSNTLAQAESNYQAALREIDLARLHIAGLSASADLTDSDGARWDIRGLWAVLNPFNIENRNGTNFLTTGKTKGLFVIEFDFENRWVNRTNAHELRDVYNGRNAWKQPIGWDYGVRLSYALTDDSDVSGSTIAGTDAFSIEAMMAKHLIKWKTDAARYSVSLEVAGGAVTDKQLFDIHARAFIGPSFVVNWKDQLQFMTRIGWATVEVPDLISDDRQVKSTGGVPVFKREFDLYSLESELRYALPNVPLTVFAGGRIYGNANPNPWAVFIGTSFEIDKVFKKKEEK